MKKQTQAIHLEYERRDAYDSLSVPVYNTLAYEFDNAAVMLSLIHISEPTRLA